MKKNIFFIAAFCLMHILSFAQSKSYGYDNVGNRVLRHLTVCSSCRTVQNTPPAEHKEVDTTAVLAVQHGLSVFPNPTQDKVVLSLSNLKDDETTSLIVTDETGKIVYSAKNLQAQNEINVSSFNNGTYFLRVTMGKDVMVYKVMKVQ